jgi:hypothetical protein
MDPHQRRWARQIAHLQDRGLFHAIGEAANAEMPEAAGKIGFGNLA